MPAGDAVVEPIMGEHPDDIVSTKNTVLTEVKQTSTTTTAASHVGDVAAIDDELSDEDCPSPTAEELVTLRRVANKIPPWLFTIAFIELCERFSYYGSTVVFTNFIQQPLPPGSTTGASTYQPGALGMGQRASTGITTFNQFWGYSLPLLGAWVADAHWGRYKTISVALGVGLFGHCLLVLAAIPPVIVHPHAALACLILAILVIGFGTGGFKPNVSCLIVEQLGEQRLFVKTLYHKDGSRERVIVDPGITTERMYMWFYFCINVGALVGQLTMVYAEQHVGFYLAFTLPTVMLAVCPLVMFWCRRRYIHRAPSGGSVLVPAFKTFFLAQGGRWSVNPWRTWRNMHDGTFWENVKPSRFSDDANAAASGGRQRPEWMRFDDAWVDELRRGFAACAVFCWYPIFWLCDNQIGNNLISQAAVLTRHGIPNDVLSNLNPIALLIIIPLNDFFIYPTLRRFHVRITPIRKITAGFFCAAAAMIWAAVVQHYIYVHSSCGDHASGRMPDPADPSGGKSIPCPPADINVWVQTGSYVLLALAEVLASVTSLEYAYSKAPKNMRSMVQAVSLFMSAFAAAIGQALTGLATDPLLVWNYVVCAALGLVATVCFFLQFRDLDRQEDELNELPEGRMFTNASDERILPMDEKSTS